MSWTKSSNKGCDVDEDLIAKYPELERRHFWWATRRRLVMEMYRSWFPGGGARILDVGCGSGVTVDSLARAGADVVGVDLEVSTADSPGRRIVSGDYLELGQGLGEFDLVMALDVVEHFEDDSRVLKTIAGNTRNGGKVLITVPAFQWLWSSHDEHNNHYRRYTRSTLTAAMTAAGLDVQRAGYLFLGLLLPKWAITVLERISREPGSTGTDVGALNGIASVYFRLETAVAMRLYNFLPLGTSVVAVATTAR